MKTIFKSNKNMMNLHFKINWKIILFFSICVVVISSFAAIFATFNHITDPKAQGVYIGSWTYKKTSHGIHSSSNHISVITGMSTIIGMGLFAGPGIVIFSIFSIVLINQIFIKDISKNYISMWLTSPVSRSQIFVTKYLFLISSLLIILSPMILIFIFLGFISKDFNVNGQYLFESIVSFILFFFFICSLFTILAIILANNGVVYNSIIGLLLCYVLFTWTIHLWHSITPSENKWMEYIDYISIQSLMPYSLEYSQESKGATIIISESVVLIPKLHKDVQIWWAILSQFLMIGLTCILLYLANLSFYKKDLSI